MIVDAFLTIREAARELDVSEDNVLSLVKKERVVAYRIGGEYIRLKKEDVLALKGTFWTQPATSEAVKRSSFWQMVKSSSVFVVLTSVCLGLGYYIIHYLL